MSKIESSKCYAVLMEVVYFNPSVAVYLPKRLIGGTLEYDDDLGQEYFLDEFLNSYLEMHEPDTIQNMAVEVVGYIITEDELMRKYSKTLFQDVEDMRATYYKECSKQAHFGFYVFPEDGDAYVQILAVDFTKFMDCFIKFPETIETTKELSFEELQEKLGTIQTEEKTINSENPPLEGLIVFTKEAVEEMLSLDDGETIKRRMQDAYYGLINALQEHLQQNVLEKVYFEKGKKIEEGEIRNFFDFTHKLFLNETNFFDFQKNIQCFNQNLEDLLCFLNSFLEEKQAQLVFEDDFIYQLFIVAGEVAQLEDLELAKNTLCAAFRESAKDIDKLAFEYSQLLEKEADKKEEFVLDSKFNAKEMKRYLDEVVIGQEAAKKKMISTVIRNALTDDYLTKNTCLLIGPTGSGKTLLARTIGEYLEKPVVFIDSTQLTMQGYKGHDLEEFLVKLLDSASGNQEKAENGIVVFDEIDKKATNGGLELDGFAKGVMDMLLSFIEGTTYNLSYRQRNISFNTAKLTVFATGSFEEMVKKMKSEQAKGYAGSKIGFHASNFIENEIYYPNIQLDDLRKYGNVPPELIGRISSIVQLDAMTKESLKEIMTSSRGSILLSEKRIFEKLGVDLCWTNGYLEKIAECAIGTRTGARSLKREIEKSVEEARIEANVCYFEGREYAAVLLHEGTVIDPLDCEFIDFCGNSVLLSELRNSEKLENSKKKIKKM